LSSIDCVIRETWNASKPAHTPVKSICAAVETYSTFDAPACSTRAAIDIS
jgi:hypothetical protein